jgi:hypothetical protein
MKPWKKAIVAGAAIGSMVMFLKRKPGAGMVLGAVGLVTVASEYPEQFARIRRNMPDYLDSGMKLVEFASRAGDRIAEYASRRGRDAWDEIRS